MVGVDVAAAELAPAAVALRGLVFGQGVFAHARDLHRLRLPEGEGVDGGRAPAAAGVAVTIAHGRGLAADAELDSAAEAAAGIRCQDDSFRVMDARVSASTRAAICRK